MTIQRHARHAAPHRCVWVGLALSLLLLLVSCPVQGADEILPAEKALLVSVAPQPVANGVFKVETLLKDAWMPVGETAHSRFPSEKTLEIKGLVPGQPTRIRITAQCPGAAPLDAVVLGGYAPIAVRNALLRKLVAADDDLNNVHGRRMGSPSHPALSFPHRLGEQPVQPQFTRVAKLFQADGHAIVPGGGLVAIGAEQAVPPGQVEAEVAVRLGA